VALILEQYVYDRGLELKPLGLAPEVWSMLSWALEKAIMMTKKEVKCKNLNEVAVRDVIYDPIHLKMYFVKEKKYIDATDRLAIHCIAEHGAITIIHNNCAFNLTREDLVAELEKRLLDARKELRRLRALKIDFLKPWIEKEINNIEKAIEYLYSKFKK